MTEGVLVYIALGSNLSGPEIQCIKAAGRLARIPGVVVSAGSSLYRTEPVGLETRNWFINGVIEARTVLGPRRLLETVTEVELQAGRDRRAGSDRTLDLDILYYGNLVICETDLEIPHPRLACRGFVLEPWSEIAAGTVVRPWNVSVKELLARLPAKGPRVERLKESCALSSSS